MKNVVLAAKSLIMLGVLVNASCLFADTITVPSQPSEVTVFPQGAQVMRVGEADLPAGPVTAAFDNLPVGLVEGSIRLNVLGPKGTKFLGVRHEQDFTPESKLERRRELERAIQEIEDQKADVSDRVQARQAEMDILKSLAAQTAAQRPALSMATLPTDIGGVGKRLSELMAASRKDQRLVRDLYLKEAGLRSELSQLGGNSRQSRRAEADLELPAAGHVRFELTYHVPDATWRPIYDLRLLSGAEPKAVLSFAGEVRQNSGEDWRNVQVELSTAQPSAYMSIPDPTQWWLDFVQPVPVYNYNKRRSSMAGMAAPSVARKSDDLSMMSVQPEEVEQAQVEMAQTTQSEFSTSFTIKRAMTIPTKGTAHRLAIAETEHPATVLLVAVPRLAQMAFIEADIKYQGEQPLLSGQAQLFRDDVYVASTQLNSVGPGETFKLGFGQDDQVKVKRDLISQKSAPGGGFFFASGKRRYHWQTTVKNLHSGDRKLEIREQLPRSKQTDIKVETLELDPKPLPEDPNQPGLTRWSLDLPAKGERKVTLRYQVSYPPDKRVQGIE